MRLVVTGSRNWPSRDDVWWMLSSITMRRQFVLVHGDCPTGADHHAQLWAEFHRNKIETYPADWDTHDKKAGPIRNAQMVDSGVDLVVGFIYDNSKGATHTIDYAQNKGIPTIVSRRYS